MLLSPGNLLHTSILYLCMMYMSKFRTVSIIFSNDDYELCDPYNCIYVLTNISGRLVSAVYELSQSYENYKSARSTN
jgi:hypothetical protein